jgi:hypothetical protein
MSFLKRSLDAGNSETEFPALAFASSDAKDAGFFRKKACKKL